MTDLQNSQEKEKQESFIDYIYHLPVISLELKHEICTRHIDDKDRHVKEIMDVVTGGKV